MAGNHVQYLIDKNLYHIKVKRYMTEKSSETFDFMKRFNHDVPMPSEYMSGYKIKETKGMVYMQLRMDISPYTTWQGWVIKSAILSNKSENQLGTTVAPVVAAKPYLQVVITQQKTRYLVTVEPHSFQPFLMKQLEEDMKTKYYAKKDSSGIFHLPISEYENFYLKWKEYCRVTNSSGYDFMKDFEFACIPKYTDYPQVEFKLTPYQHQIEAYHFGMQRDTFLIADEQGLGKSCESIQIAIGKKEQFGYPHCLVICGVNSLKQNWVNEIKLHSNEKGHILGFRKKRVGDSNRKFKDLELVEQGQIEDYFLITNAESLRNKKIASKIKDLCEQKIIGMVIVDEFHKINNVNSQQGANLLKVNAETMIALTGTPILNNPLDLYPILRWLGYEKHSLSVFKKHYTITGGEHNQIIGYRHMEELTKNLSTLMLRRKKEDVLDLPDKVYLDEYVEMSPAQEKIYQEVYDALLSDIDLISNSLNPLSKMLRLRQATAHTGILSSTVQESCKIDRLKELVENTVTENRKVIIFSNWTEVTDRVEAELKAYHPLVITGNTPDSKRQEIVHAFQEDPVEQVIIGTIGAMGTGLTLTAADTVIFMDEPWTAGAKEQAIDRAHRIGTQNTVFVYTLMCKDTIDERVHLLLQNKKDISEMVVDNSQMTKFLLGLEEKVPDK